MASVACDTCGLRAGLWFVDGLVELQATTTKWLLILAERARALGPVARPVARTSGLLFAARTQAAAKFILSSETINFLFWLAEYVRVCLQLQTTIISARAERALRAGTHSAVRVRACATCMMHSWARARIINRGRASAALTSDHEHCGTITLRCARTHTRGRDVCAAAHT